MDTLRLHTIHSTLPAIGINITQCIEQLHASFLIWYNSLTPTALKLVWYSSKRNSILIQWDSYTLQFPTCSHLPKILSKICEYTKMLCHHQVSNYINLSLSLKSHVFLHDSDYIHFILFVPKCSGSIFVLLSICLLASLNPVSCQRRWLNSKVQTIFHVMLITSNYELMNH